MAGARDPAREGTVRPVGTCWYGHDNEPGRAACALCGAPVSYDRWVPEPDSPWAVVGGWVDVHPELVAGAAVLLLLAGLLALLV